LVFQLSIDFLDQVEAIARAGADRLLEYWRQLDRDQIDEKARNDLVTVADREAEATVLAEIGRRFPDHPVLSEESGWNGRQGAGPTWIVDPLDGTTNFVHGFPHFAVSVGVVADDTAQAGVIIDPVKGDVFRAARGMGLWWNGTRVTVSDRPGLDGAMVATGFPFRAHRLLKPYLAIFHDVFLACNAIRRPGAAALDLAYTACGIVDGFFEFHLSPWDIAAGAVMVEEAGGTISDMDGGRDFLATGNVVCGTHGVHRDLLAIIQHHRDDWTASEE
jgi:myo-inositol-1(or 4)-monophosphatase